MEVNKVAGGSGVIEGVLQGTFSGAVTRELVMVHCDKHPKYSGAKRPTHWKTDKACNVCRFLYHLIRTEVQYSEGEKS